VSGDEASFAPGAFANPASRAPGAAGEYVRALLALLGDRDPLAVLAETPDALERATSGVSAERLRAPEAPGKWSVTAVVAHLADSEIVCAWRLRHVLADDDPHVGGYDQDAWARRLRYEEADLEGSLRLFRVVRVSNVRLLRAASPAELARVGQHAERGPESIEHMARLYAGHDLVHRRQIARILAAVG
jgi:hypothetical protein